MDLLTLFIRVIKQVKEIFVCKLNPILFGFYNNDSSRYYIESLNDPYLHLFYKKHILE